MKCAIQKGTRNFLMPFSQTFAKILSKTTQEKISLHTKEFSFSTFLLKTKFTDIDLWVVFVNNPAYLGTNINWIVDPHYIKTCEKIGSLDSRLGMDCWWISFCYIQSKDTHWIIQFHRFDWLRDHGISAILPCARNSDH